MPLVVCQGENLSLCSDYSGNTCKFYVRGVSCQQNFAIITLDTAADTFVRHSIYVVRRPNCSDGRQHIMYAYVKHHVWTAVITASFQQSTTGLHQSLRAQYSTGFQNYLSFNIHPCSKAQPSVCRFLTYYNH